MKNSTTTKGCCCVETGPKNMILKLSGHDSELEMDFELTRILQFKAVLIKKIREQNYCRIPRSSGSRISSAMRGNLRGCIHREAVPERCEGESFN